MLINRIVSQHFLYVTLLRHTYGAGMVILRRLYPKFQSYAITFCINFSAFTTKRSWSAVPIELF